MWKKFIPQKIFKSFCAGEMMCFSGERYLSGYFGKVFALLKGKRRSAQESCQIRL